MNATDYDRDFYQWTQQQADLLRRGQLSRIDVANLAEEVESMGKSDRRALGSHLMNVLLHLLKWRYQPHRRGASWALKNFPETCPFAVEQITSDYWPDKPPSP